jgi:hypothetical protein
MDERWLPVVGYEDRYDVSDQGRVRATTSWRRWKAGRILGGTPHRRGGYLRVALRDADGGARYRFIHDLVLEAFVGPAPAGLQSRHGDGDPRNNALSNLSWGTALENAADRERHGRTARGDRSGKLKLTDADLAAIRERVARGETQRALAAEYGVTAAYVNDVLRGRTKR